jgi:hypothetical protein
MTYANYSADTAPKAGVWNTVLAWMERVGHALFVSRGMEARMLEFQRLDAMTDAQLQEKGLRREDIARHVFRDVVSL